MSKYTIVPRSKEDIDYLLDKDIKGLIIGVKNLSIYEYELDVDSILGISNKTDRKIIIAINKMIHNNDLDYVKEVLSKVKNTNISILFHDLGVLNIIKELNEIKKNTGMNIYYTVYGYLPIFYSRRSLVTNYFKYIDKEVNDDKYYIINKDNKYLIKEKEYGTIIYIPLVNLINDLDKIEDIDNYVIDLSYITDNSIIDSILNNNVEGTQYKGFFDIKTTYKIKEEE